MQCLGHHHGMWRGSCVQLISLEQVFAALGSASSVFRLRFLTRCTGALCWSIVVTAPRPPALPGRGGEKFGLSLPPFIPASSYPRHPGPRPALSSVVSPYTSFPPFSRMPCLLHSPLPQPFPEAQKLLLRTTSSPVVLCTPPKPTAGNHNPLPCYPCGMKTSF